MHMYGTVPVHANAIGSWGIGTNFSVSLLSLLKEWENYHVQIPKRQFILKLKKNKELMPPPICIEFWSRYKELECILTY